MKLTDHPHEARDSLRDRIATRGLTSIAGESMDAFGQASRYAVAEPFDAPVGRISTDAPIPTCSQVVPAIATQTFFRLPSPMYQRAGA